MNTEKRCRWCYRTAGEIRAILNEQLKQPPVRIFDRDDAWAKCVLCKSSKQGKRHSDTTPAAGRGVVVAQKRHFKTPKSPNRSEPQ